MNTTCRTPSENEELTLHSGEEHLIFERADQSPHPTDLIVSPVELHQRNVQRRLRERTLPKDAFAFVDPVGVAVALCHTAGHDTATIDRIDRLSLLRSILDGEPADDPRRIPLPSGDADGDPQQVEQLRTEVETTTNFHPERIAAWRETAADCDAPIDADAESVLDAAIRAEQELRDRTTTAVSETALLRVATRSLSETDGGVWNETYPRIERLSLVGLSSLSAPQADLVHALCATTAVDVHLHFRSGTGPYLASRVQDLLTVTAPGSEVFQ